jgi:hypothetical protein
LHGRLSEEQIAVNDALKSYLSGGSGIVDDRKRADVFRIMGENINSICLYDDSRCQEKVTKIRQINQRFQTDMALFNELGVDLRQVPAEKSLDTNYLVTMTVDSSVQITLRSLVLGHSLAELVH